MSRPRIGLLEWFRPGEHERVERVLADMRALGVRHLRTGFSWADWHTRAGEEWYGWLIPRLAREVEVLPCFLYTPPSLGVEPRSSSPPREPKRFADFIDVVITRFGDHFEYVELWNEPNNRAEWDWTLDPEWVKFAETIGGAAYWAKRRRKKVVLGGMSPFDPNWLDLMFERGVMQYVDVVGVHGFPGTWEPIWDGWSHHIHGVQRVLDRHGSPARIWITETGFSTWDLDERQQLARFLDVYDLPVERAYWYAVDDLPYDVASNVGFHLDEREYHFGLKRASGGKKLLYRLWEESGLDGLPEWSWITTPPRRESDHAPAPVVITGGAGFVGANLAHRLLSTGRPVLLLDNLSRPTAVKNLRWLRDVHGGDVQIDVVDIRDAHAVKAAVARASAVFHLAAQVAVTTSLVDPHADFEVNARGTLNVLEALRAREDPPPLVFTSTNKVYGRMADLSVRRAGARYAPDDADVLAHGVGESRPIDFHSPYGCSKGAADQYVLDYARTYGLPATVFRMSCIYGPHQFGTEDQGWVAHFVIRAMQSEPLTIYGDGCQVRDVLYVDDLVDAFLAAEANIDRIKGRAFNIGGGPENTLSLLELLDAIQELGGGKARVDFADWRPGDQPWYVSDIRAFSKATGWAPSIGVKDGLSRLHEWVDEAIMLPQLAEKRGVLPHTRHPT